MVRCAMCKKELRGVSFEGSKSEKRPTRMYGGYLCHKCLEKVIKKKVRK